MTTEPEAPSDSSDSSPDASPPSKRQRTEAAPTWSPTAIVYGRDAENHSVAAKYKKEGSSPSPSTLSDDLFTTDGHDGLSFTGETVALQIIFKLN